MDSTAALKIGYIMKPSREADFAKRGAFPSNPTPNGLLFVRLTFDSPLAAQLEGIDAVLHKATDEIVGVDLSTPQEFPKGISFSYGMRELERYIETHPHCVMIDSLDCIYPVLDRNKIQQILLELEKNFTANCHKFKLRAPRCLSIDDFENPELSAKMAEAELPFPVIVKPQIACGVADAHDMALVFKPEGFHGLHVPIPAVAQEYIDHGSSLFKFYVIGERVFYAVKRSMPNAGYLSSMVENAGFGAVLFNSLKSLPVSKEEHNVSARSLDVELANDAARWLKKKLGLTIFGFDVVIQEGSGDHVIVDLNYLPSFKEVPDGDAIPAFWEAIKSSYEMMEKKQADIGCRC